MPYMHGMSVVNRSMHGTSVLNRCCMAWSKRMMRGAMWLSSSSLFPSAPESCHTHVCMCGTRLTVHRRSSRLGVSTRVPSNIGSSASPSLC